MRTVTCFASDTLPALTRHRSAPRRFLDCLASRAKHRGRHTPQPSDVQEEQANVVWDIACDILGQPYTPAKLGKEIRVKVQMPMGYLAGSPAARENVGR